MSEDRKIEDRIQDAERSVRAAEEYLAELNVRMVAMGKRLADLEYDVFGAFRKPISGARSTLAERVAALEGRLSDDGK